MFERSSRAFRPCVGVASKRRRREPPPSDGKPTRVQQLRTVIRAPATPSEPAGTPRRERRGRPPRDRRDHIAVAATLLVEPCSTSSFRRGPARLLSIAPNPRAHCTTLSTSANQTRARGFAEQSCGSAPPLHENVVPPSPLTRAENEIEEAGRRAGRPEIAYERASFAFRAASALRRRAHRKRAPASPIRWRYPHCAPGQGAVSPRQTIRTQATRRRRASSGTHPPERRSRRARNAGSSRSIAVAAGPSSRRGDIRRQADGFDGRSGSQAHPSSRQSRTTSSFWSRAPRGS
jgi:hypothetical protein